jgi:hypothetical protein
VQQRVEQVFLPRFGNSQYFADIFWGGNVLDVLFFGKRGYASPRITGDGIFVPIPQGFQGSELAVG